MSIRFVDGTRGNDKHPGTQEQPWKSLSHAAASVKPGDTVLIGAGIYYEALQIKTPDTVWLVDGATGQVILDGRYTPDERLSNGNMPAANAEKSFLPGSDYGKMLDIRADGVEVNGLIVRHVAGQPVGILGNRVKLRNCTLDFAYGGGLMAENVEDIVIENVKMFRCNQKRYDPTNTKGGPANVQVNLLFKRVKRGIIRGCEIAYNHGEGIALAVESSDCLVENNVVHTNLHMHIVLNHAQNNTIRGNFVYHSNDPEFLQRKSGDPPTGIIVSDELKRGTKLGLKRSEGNTISHNIVVGMGINLVARVSNNAVGAFRNTRVVNNTFVNAHKNKGNAINVRIPASAEHRGSLFANNIIIQDKGTIAKAPGGNGVVFENNLWSRKPEAAASGKGDLVGDPRLVDHNAPLVDGYGTGRAADPRYYMLTAQSLLAIDKAAGEGNAGPDFFGRTPVTRDLGACAFFGEPTSEPEEPEEPSEPQPPNEPEEPTDPEPEPTEDWRVHLSAEQKRLLSNCTQYANGEPGGFGDHEMILLVAYLAELLDAADEVAEEE